MYKEYDLYYPSVFENKWFNFLLVSVGILLLVFEISRYIKLRNAFVISMGAVTHLIIAAMILNFCGGVPGWAAAVYLVVSSCIVLGIHFSAIYVGKNTAPGNFISRLLAGILLTPAPFLITSAGMVAASSNSEVIINTMPFKEFINRVYEFLSNPTFNYSGKIMFTGMHYDRKMFLVSLIVAILFLVVYLVIDSTVDYRSDLKERSRHRKAAEKERVRAEISSRIHSQLERIDSCMSYISTNYKILKVRDEDMKLLRAYYDEATRIKYSYNGTASGPILKRLTAIKTEMYIIRDRIVNGLGPEENEAQGNTESSSTQNAGNGGNASGSSNTGNFENDRTSQNASEFVQSGSTTVTTGFFNGCTTEEEVKKRYRDLTKVFHPDSENGDQETFLTIKADYEELMRRIS